MSSKFNSHSQVCERLCCQVVVPVIEKRCLLMEIKWVPPQLEWVRVNTDRSVLGDGRADRCGGVLRNKDGSWLGDFSKYLGVTSAFIAELWGC